jgi:hypothetical protein
MLEWIQPQLSAELRDALQRAIDHARGAPRRPDSAAASTISELSDAAEDQQQGADDDQASEPGEGADGAPSRGLWLLLAAFALVAAGMATGLRHRARSAGGNHV